MRVVGKEEMRDTTLLIQGPLMEDTYKFYCGFYPEVPKIFSTWEKNSMSNAWKGEANMHSPHDIYFESQPPNRVGIWERRMELVLVCTLLGLDRTSTEFTVLLRGDEWYSNLNLVAELVRDDKEGRLFMAPIFMKKWEAWPFRMSDHLLAGRTADLRLMFETCLINVVLRKEMNQSCWPLPFQSILAMGYLKKKRPEGGDSKKDFKELFGTVDLEKLKYYKVRSDTGSESWYSNFKPYISSLGEL